MAADNASLILQHHRVAVLGKTAGMARRQFAQLVRQHGGAVVELTDPTVNLIVLGEEDLPFLQADEQEKWFPDALRKRVEAGEVKIITETQLWHRLGLVDIEQGIQRLYTPAMLAELLKVPVTKIRQWHRRGWIRPVREVHRLPYFDFQEVAAARRLAELLSAGVSPRALEQQLAALARYCPQVARPLAQLSLIVRGKGLLLREGGKLLEPRGQMHFDFEAVEEAPEPKALPASPAQLMDLAAELEEDGRLAEAADMYRAALAAAGPTPELCFQLAEVLYRLGDLEAARERYFMAIELDEDFVEARANLGCLLAETGQYELAVAAFEGALRFHPQYADVHYHLARTLDELGRHDQADSYWRTFLELAPESPWAEEARSRLNEA